MSADLESLKRQIRAACQDDRKTTVRLNMADFEKLADHLQEVAGLEGLCVLTGRRAFLFLATHPQVAFLVRHSCVIAIQDIQRLGFRGKFIGGKVHERSFLRFLIEELRSHWVAVTVLTTVTILFFSLQVEIDTYITLAQAALGVVAVFVAVHLAFISLFYSSSRFRPEYYLSQTYSDFANNDRNVTYMAMMSIWLSVMTIVAGKVSYDQVKLPVGWWQAVAAIDPWFQWLNRANSLPVVTGLNLLLIHLSLVAITEYYLERTREERIQAAVQELREEFVSKLRDSGPKV